MFLYITSIVWDIEGIAKSKRKTVPDRRSLRAYWKMIFSKHFVQIKSGASKMYMYAVTNVLVRIWINCLFLVEHQECAVRLYYNSS